VLEKSFLKIYYLPLKENALSRIFINAIVEVKRKPSPDHSFEESIAPNTSPSSTTASSHSSIDSDPDNADDDDKHSDNEDKEEDDDNSKF